MIYLCLVSLLLFLGVHAKSALRGERLFDGGDEPTTTPVPNFGEAVISDNSDYPVISRAAILMVLYGPGTYINQITGNGFANFYTEFMKSPQFTWVKQYKTQGAVNGTSNQVINKQGGVFLGKKQLPLASVPLTITKAAFIRQFRASLANGDLPLPNLDGLGFVNTLYVFHFPAGHAVSYASGDTSQISCVQWCGYHDFIPYVYTLNGQQVTKHIPYALIPDMSPGSGCFDKCGSHNSSFLITMSTVVHEIIEAVTDPWGMSGWEPGFFSGNEISDRCEGVDEGFKVGTTQYTVQRSWSNNQHQCIGNNNSSFTILLLGGTNVFAFDLGDPQFYWVFTNNYTNPPKQIAFNCWGPGLPPGWSCSFNPPTVTAGEGTNLTIISAGAAPVGYWPQITVVGTQTPELNTNARIKIVLPVSNLLNGLFNDDLNHWTQNPSGGTGEFYVSTVGGSEANGAVVNASSGQLSLSQQWRINSRYVLVGFASVCVGGDFGNIVIQIKSGGKSVASSTVQQGMCSPNPNAFKVLPFDLLPYLGRLATLTLFVNGPGTFGIFFNIVTQNTDTL